tara:strand:- start:14110 stop:14502 length:393 start_codon:yes stop_codon:yes gene_type:complete
MQITNIKPAQTARMIRKALKAEYSETQFSVTTESYTGGASIDISYTDGPSFDEMREFVAPFKGAGFDSMVDYQYNVDAWLLSDGTVQIAQVEGTDSMLGSVPTVSNPAPTADAQLVHFGADYIFHRQYAS